MAQQIVFDLGSFQKRFWKWPLCWGAGSDRLFGSALKAGRDPVAARCVAPLRASPKGTDCLC